MQQGGLSLDIPTIRTLFSSRRETKKVLNVGGGSKSIPLPPIFADYEHLLLDIDPKGGPDIVGDAKHLEKLGKNKFDAVYCSHNLEHFYFHEVPMVLSGMYHVIKPDGFVYIRVPDILAAIDLCRKANLDLEEGLYMASGVPIMTLDVIYGWSFEIQKSGQPYYAHKTAFTESSLRRKLTEAGFVVTLCEAHDLEFTVIAKKPV